MSEKTFSYTINCTEHQFALLKWLANAEKEECVKARMEYENEENIEEEKEISELVMKLALADKKG